MSVPNHAWRRLRWGPLARYLAVGLITWAVFIGGIYLLGDLLALPGAWVSVGMFVSATALNYVLHYYVSFRARTPHAETSLRFLAVVALGAGLSAGIPPLARGLGLPLSLGAAVFSVAWVLVSYAALRGLVFAQHRA